MFPVRVALLELALSLSGVAGCCRSGVLAPYELRIRFLAQLHSVARTEGGQPNEAPFANPKSLSDATRDKPKMSQSKYLAIGLVVIFGVGNGMICRMLQTAPLRMLTRLTAYYSFNPSLQEMKERREAAAARCVLILTVHRRNDQRLISGTAKRMELRRARYRRLNHPPNKTSPDRVEQQPTLQACTVRKLATRASWILAIGAWKWVQLALAADPTVRGGRRQQE